MDINITRLRYLAALTLFLLSPAARVNAEITLPKILGDNMVLQRDRPVSIWGRAAAGEEVTVRFTGQEKRAKADAQGNWRVSLNPLAASAQPREMTVSAGGDTLRLRNLLVGEVWLCSGQSNMEMPVATGTKPDAPVATTTDKALAEDVRGEGFALIRLFKVEKVIMPPDVTSTGWNEARGNALAEFSAIGYIFARELQRELGVPVGMMQAAWGGARIEPWTPPEAYAPLPAFSKEAASEKLTIDGVAPGKNYNGMVRPLAPFAIRGVLWYQGESNIIEGNDGLRYADKMQALVGGGLKIRDGRRLTHFEIAGADGNFHTAQATVEGKNVVVSSPQVSKPLAVRFAWNETAQPNLVNAEGWPAFPFRSNGPEWNPQPLR